MRTPISHRNKPAQLARLFHQRNNVISSAEDEHARTSFTPFGPNARHLTVVRKARVRKGTALFKALPRHIRESVLETILSCCDIFTGEECVMPNGSAVQSRCD